MTKTFRIAGSRIGAVAAGIAFAATVAAQAPDRTPTPAPRLSGGFGRPRTTAVPTPNSETGGQAFSDVVHAAREARDGAVPEKSAVTINNKSLVKNTEKGKVSTSKAAAAKPRPATAAPAVTAATTVVAPLPEAAADPADSPTGGTEAEWKAIAGRDHKAVADAKARVAELEATSKKLENDFYAWDDGQYRDRVIKPAWDHARTDLETAKQQLVDAEKTLADLPERARKAGALPGWIRE
jgi:hypothetical protein